MAEPWTILAVISLRAEVWFPNFVQWECPWKNCTSQL